MRGWGPIRKLLVERERELKWLHNAAGKKKKKNSHSLPLFLPESLQNLINSALFYLKVSLILNTHTRSSTTEQAELSHPLKWTVNLDWSRWCHQAGSNRLKCSKWKTAGPPQLWEPLQDTVSLNSSQFHFWPDHRHSHSCGCSIKVSLPDYSLWNWWGAGWHLYSLMLLATSAA